MKQPGSDSHSAADCVALRKLLDFSVLLFTHLRKMIYEPNLLGEALISWSPRDGASPHMNHEDWEREVGVMH